MPGLKRIRLALRLPSFARFAHAHKLPAVLAPGRRSPCIGVERTWKPRERALEAAAAAGAQAFCVVARHYAGKGFVRPRWTTHSLAKNGI